MLVAPEDTRPEMRMFVSMRTVNLGLAVLLPKHFLPSPLNIFRGYLTGHATPFRKMLEDS